MIHADLITAVESRLNRTDLTALIPSFIQRTEDVIRAKLAANPVRPMGASATSVIAAGDTDFGVPSDFIDVIDMSVSDGTVSWQLLRLNPFDPISFHADRSLPYATAYDSSKPRHYSILGDTASLSAASEDDLTATLKYFQKLPTLSLGENWFAAAHANVYEFGTCAFAYRHMRDEQGAKDEMDLFLGALDLALESYPEQSYAGERRSDMPNVTAPWSILNG